MTMTTTHVSAEPEVRIIEAILEVVSPTYLLRPAPRDEPMRHGWTSRLVAISIPGPVIHPRTGILTRDEAYPSPLAALAIERVEQGFADNAQEKVARRTQVGPTSVR
jgi:hypothetical protein